MFGQFFSTIKMLLLLFLSLICFSVFATDQNVPGIDVTSPSGGYIGESLEILSEKALFENMDELNDLPEDIQHVLLSGRFSSDPHIQVRIQRIARGGYQAEIKYANSPETYSLDWGVENFLDHRVTAAFRESGKEVPVIDFTEHAHWLRLLLVNPTDMDIDMILELDKNIYSWFDLFYYKGDGPVSLYGSYEDPMSARVIRESNIIFPIEIPPGDTVLYMRMESQFYDSVPIRIRNASQFHSLNNLNKFFNGIVSGITFIMIAYAIYLAYSFQERGYLYLAALIISGFMIHISESGLGMIFIWPEHPMGSVILFSIAMPLTILVNLLFCRHYLSIVKFTPFTDKIVLFMLSAAAVLFAVQFFIPIYSRYGFTMMSIFLDYLSVIPLLYAALVSYRREKKGNRTSVYILAAIGFQLLSYIEFWLSRLNIIPLGLIDFIHVRSIGFAIVMLGGVRFKMQILEGTILSLRTKLEEIMNARSEEQNRKSLTDKTQLKVEAVRELIEKSYDEALYRDDLAASVGLSSDHLGRMFKKLTGEKISDYINRLRIEESCRKLSESDMKIIDIAYEVGFDNLRTFNMRFSKQMKMSPSEFRKREDPE